MLGLSQSHIDQKVVNLNLICSLAILEKLSLKPISLDPQSPSLLTLLHKPLDHQLLSLVRHHINLRMNILCILTIRPQNHRNLLADINSDRMSNFELLLKMSTLDELPRGHENITHKISVSPSNPLHSQSLGDSLDELLRGIP